MLGGKRSDSHRLAVAFQMRIELKIPRSDQITIATLELDTGLLRLESDAAS